MYDKYYLSEQQVNLIETWPINKPLFIYGLPGVGKTSLAIDILKGTTLTVIDSSHIKKNENLYDYLLNIIQKRNITLMFQKKTCRGIILDNLDIFYKHDKKNFKAILKLLETYSYYGTRIIVIFDKKLLKNRALQKINNVSIQLSYSKHIFFKIVNNILIQKNIKSSFGKVNLLLTQSNYNLNSIHSVLEYDDKSISPLDNFDSNELIFEKIITQNMDCSEILRLCIGEEGIISLNLLENITDYIYDLGLINKIYRNYIISDLFDIHSIIYHNNEFRNYSCIMNIFTIHYYLKQILNIQFKPFIYNKYISRSLIQTHSHKLNYNYVNQYKSIIHMYLFGLSNTNLPFIKERLKTIEKKELEYYIKSFNFFYDSKIKIKKIYN